MTKQIAPRKTSTLPSNLDRSLSSYALFASAAGVSLLALTQPAAASIVYTQVHHDIGKATLLDLNGDGINDFRITHTVSSICNGSHCGIRQTQAIDTFNRLSISGAGASNQALGAGGYISQLGPGVTVGSNGAFQGNKLLGGIYGVDGEVLSQYGPWRQGGGTHKGYVGLKFTINGETHFGWARVITLSGFSTAFRAVLTGYAYETTPNTPIITGKTSSATHASVAPEIAPAVSHQSLGTLALGTNGLSIWRRKEDLA